jgi:hypothetical protein
MANKPCSIVHLSSRGLANLGNNVYENDFTFVVGEERYQCPSFIATFLSPRIAQQQLIDPTIEEYKIESADPNHYF